MALLTPQQGANQLRRRARRIVTELAKAEAGTADIGVAIARDMSSGTFSTRQLAAMGSPYARRHGGMGVPHGDPGVINEQTGAFYRRWFPIKDKRFTNVIFNAVVNDSPIAGYLKRGTRTMIDRPIEERVRAFLQPIRVRRIATAIKKATS